MVTEVITSFIYHHHHRQNYGFYYAAHDYIKCLNNGLPHCNIWITIFTGWFVMIEGPSKKEIQEFVVIELNKQVNFCIHKFDLGETWSPLLNMSFAKNRKHSRAGRNVDMNPFIDLSLVSYLHPVSGFVEYARYSTNMLIGSFKNTKWQTCLTALISHELAHAVQFTLPVVNTSLRSANHPEMKFHELGEYGEGHGTFFQSIYRQLRKAFVNHQIDPNLMGITPPPQFAIEKHPMAGTVFHHVVLGKCVITNYYPKARIYPYEFMTVSGKLFKSSIERMQTMALFDFYSIN